MDSPHLSTDEVSWTEPKPVAKADGTSSSPGSQSCSNRGGKQIMDASSSPRNDALSYGTASTTSEQTPTADDIFADLHPASPLPVLIRATNGKPADETDEKIKLSTVVKPEALETFYTRYAEVWKAGMHGLRKRDRSARKKAKAKKRKGGGEGEKKA